MSTTILDLEKLAEAVQAPLDASVKTVPDNVALEAIERACLTESELDALEIPPRLALLGDWFFEGDLGYIFGPRGGGKTWLDLHIARALVEGSKCGPWQAPAPVKCLLIDGEMPLGEMKKRNQALRGCVGENLILLSHQRLFDTTGANLCLTDEFRQKAVTDYCVKHGVKVVFLDNLSTLFTHVEENKADDWRDFVEGWLLELRRRGIAVVIVAHAGRSGTMRGTSKREDCAFWQIALDPLEKDGEGVRFTSRFTKNRNASTDPASLKWHFRPEGDRVIVTYQPAEALQLFRDWIQDGLTTCTDISEAMGVSKGQVSRLAKKAEREGWLTTKGREYILRVPSP